MEDSACNFYINDNFNPNYDITWSFQYSVTGNNYSTGGFSTFLFNNTELIGGGPYYGLGYSDYQDTKGVQGAVLGILFYSNDTIQIKIGNNFAYLCSFPLFSSLYPLIKKEHEFNTIRFNLTDFGQTLNIAVKTKYGNDYTNIFSTSVDLSVVDVDFYKIGFSYVSPIESGDDKIEFKIKDIHIQGNKNFPSVVYSKKPYSIESNYLLLSPQSGKIEIGKPDPISVGYLLHK